ncbi:transposable element Tcb1 transposase [Trichonephila clavipes]|nr:transposable element Tcb1 transposase [Trichonephila clavipes]
MSRILRHNDKSVREGYIRNDGKEVKLFTSALKAFRCNNRIVMAQRNHLDDFLRSRIIGRLECGRTQMEVSEELGIAQSVISRLWQRFQDDVNVSRCYRTGRPGLQRQMRTGIWQLLPKETDGAQHQTCLAALFSYRYYSFKVDRVQTLRAHWSICSKACQMFSNYRNSLSPAINLEYRTCIVDTPQQWSCVVFSDESRTDLDVQSVTMTDHIYRDVILQQHVRLFRGAMGVEFMFVDHNHHPHRANIVDECL